jgi:hypothetical protein
MERTWMKKCCGLCPFARIGTLGLHPERAEELAYMASNPFNDFPCHKTADYLETDNGDNDGYIHGEHSFTCHGFKTLQMSENASTKDFESQGFKPDGYGFEDCYDMIDRHQELYDEQQRKTK